MADEFDYLGLEFGDRGRRTDAAIEAKFLDLSNGILPPAQARKTIDLCWNAEKLASAGDIAKAAAI